MEHPIATASVDLLGIKKREYSHLLFRGLQKIAQGPSEDVCSLLLYPVIESKSVFADLRNRLGWYLPEGSYEQCDIHVLGDDSLRDVADTPTAQAIFQTDQLTFQMHSRSEAPSLSNEVDRILVWDKNHRLDAVTVPRIGKIGIVDPTYYSTFELSTWSQVTNNIRHTITDHSCEKYLDLERSFEDTDVSYVFGTGPSLDDVFNIEIPSDSLSIICNSIVKDKELLDHLQPDILVFADPVFHFGPSRYADKFREDVVQTLQEYDCTAVMPERYYTLFVGNYPELTEQIIGVESVGTDGFILPTHEQLEVRGTSNIMTLFMIPVAASLTEEVRIIGADGRKENESYFWEHSDIGQYDDELMDTVAEAHPAFFRDRIYEDYYNEHVETLTDIIEYSESQGVDVHSMTNSYIPCLSERRVNLEELRLTEN
jgi:DNA-binding ferritin-like protein (Dps family)